VADVKIFETVKNQNCIHEEIKGRVNSGNACYRSFIIFCLPVSSIKNLQIKLYRTLMLPAVLYGCKTRCLGPKREEVAEGWRRLHNEEGAL
jgi:hypothetical protein